jgi:ferredoxin-NADP reductase
MTLRTAVLRSARRLTPEVRELTFDVVPPAMHRAGQWVSLKIPRGPELLSRSYSIASAPRADGSFDLAVTRVEGGPGSTFLHALAPGEGLTVGEPMGFFTLPDVLDAPLLLVGTGTGVAPLRAMLQDLVARGLSPPTTLLLGVRTEDDALYADEFRALEASAPWFRFALTLSRPGDAWGGRRGYVQTHLAELSAARPGCHAYVCGLNAMLKEVRRALKEDLGFGRDRIHTERYD